MLYSCKLHKQIVIDHGEGVSLDNQSKQLYVKSKPPGWIRSHMRPQRFDRHSNSASATCHLSLVCCRRTLFFCFFVRLNAAVRLAAFHPPAWAQEPAVFFFLYISILLQSHRNLLKMKNEIGGLYVCGEHLKSGWAASWEEKWAFGKQRAVRLPPSVRPRQILLFRCFSASKWRDGN